LRCPRCGNENPATNRFCGMCGATLLQTQTPGAVTTAPARTTVAAPSPPPPSAPPVSAPPSPVPAPPRASVADESPVISGPSFLGLNEPAPARRRGSLSIDPNSAGSSRNLDYLLEDDEPRHGGSGKYILIVVALALALGLGYLRWKNQGFAWLNAPKKPAAATQDSNSADSNAPAVPATAPNSSTAPSTSSTPTQPATGAPPADNSAASAALATTAPAQPAPPQPAPAQSAPATQLPHSDAGDSTAATPAASAPASATTQPPAPADTDSDTKNADAPTKNPAPVAPKPRPVVKAAQPGPVTEAQRYLYGKGVTQNCDRGLRILKPAADAANTKAMIEMGALYSAGLCTPRDLPTAYRWFALALHKDPDNQSVQTDLQKLWGEMTQPERQLAIRLSQ
jgi:hypothetical protein